MDSIALKHDKVIYRDQNTDVAKLREAVYRQQKAAKMRKTALRLSVNILVVLTVLLPLLYAASVAFMPSSELFTTEMNLIPKNPTLSNFRDALTKVPLAKFVINSFIVVHGLCASDGYREQLCGNDFQNHASLFGGNPQQAAGNLHQLDG